MNHSENWLALRQRCARLTADAGVYRMLDAQGKVIYVGKARHLRKRVSSYFNRLSDETGKVRAMVASTHAIEVTVTANENEALILESNLIKELRPRYNVVLRDDKSYPYIYADLEHEFPRLRFHRGARTGKGSYFGPFPNAGAVRSTLSLLQKLFMIRQCEDSFFKNRSRPCLQYQIKRCTGPCVGLIKPDVYQEDVGHAVLFLEGRGQDLIDNLVRQMEQASSSLDFELAARFRDQIANLQKVQSEQNVSGGNGNFDVVASAVKSGVGCVQVLFVRHGRVLGSKTFFPTHTKDSTSKEVLEAFLAQFYLALHKDRDVPGDLIVSEPITDDRWFQDALCHAHGRRIGIRTSVRGERARWLRMAKANAAIAIDQCLSSTLGEQERLDALNVVLGRDVAIERIECFDISHLGGESTVASCVIFERGGPRKSEYRKFNIKNATAGDDYAAMHEVLERRYRRLKTEEGVLPDLIVIDGGRGQVSQALSVLKELQIDDVVVIGVAKGASRKPGLEKLVLYDGHREHRLAADSGALHLLQHVRDEAHRFALGAHRSSRAKSRNRSPLEDIAGIGAKRRQRLMQHFGGLQGVSRAGVDDLVRVSGISQELAQLIYNSLHR